MRPEKQLLLDEIKEKMEKSNALVFARYKGLSCNQIAAFRFRIKDAGGEFTAVKKRLLIKAAAEEGLTFTRDDLEGHIGIISVYDDPITTTKEFYQFNKEHEKVFEVLGGKFEGKQCTAADIKTLSELPSMDEMRASVLGLFEAPMSETLSVVEALLTSVVHCLENKANE